MIQLTDARTAPNGCVPRTYPYWTQINNHRGLDYFFAFVGRTGQPPQLFMIDKATLAVAAMAELQDGTGEGWYFSDSRPFDLYQIHGANLTRLNTATADRETVFTLEPRHGAYLWQAHSSADDQVHSATVQNAEYQAIGCVVYRKGEQHFFPANGIYDECQIDKSGRFLVIKETVNDRLTNRICDLDAMTTRVIVDGAVGHSDCGDGTLVGEDASGDSWKLVIWNLREQYGYPRVMLEQGARPWGTGLGHVAVRGDQALVSRPDELLLVSLASYQKPRRICPSLMADHGADYDYQVRACWDAAGEFCLWLADNGTNRLDAFIERVAEPTTQPTKGSASVIPIGIFTQPEEAKLHLHTDAGADYDAVAGTKDGRPAWIFEVADDTPNGHGADITVTFKSGATLSFHGFLRTSPPEFVPDVYREPTRP